MKTKQQIHPFPKRYTLTMLLLFMGIQFAMAQQVQLYPAYSNLQDTIDTYPSGTTFMLNPGTYRLQTIEARDNDKYIGVADANGNLPILKGSTELVSAEFSQGSNANGTYWYIDGIVGAVTPQHGDCEPGFDCRRAEDVFVNGVPQIKVNTLSEMDTLGRCFIDGSRVYLRENPNGKLVELSVNKFAIMARPGTGNDLAASNVTIKNLIVEQYATPAQHGAIHAAVNNAAFLPQNNTAEGWIIENNECRYNHGGGIYFRTGATVRGNRVHHNGQIGLKASGDNMLVEDNEIAYNGNWAGYRWAWEGGGTKFSYTDSIRILNNHSHDNFGPGLWTDIVNTNALYEGNRVENNSGSGIFHEISYNAIIKCNTLTNNWHNSGAGNLSGGNILIANSSDVEVFENVCISSGLTRGNGIIIKCGPDRNGTVYYADSNHIHNNDIIFRANANNNTNYTGLLIPNDCTGANGNLFENNRYHSYDADESHFLWGPQVNGYTNTLTWAQDSIQQELGSTIDGNTANPLTQFTIGTITSESIALNWQGNIGGEFKVYWRVESENTWQSANVTTNAYTITGLEPDTEYRLMIKNGCANRFTIQQTATTLSALSCQTSVVINAAGDEGLELMTLEINGQDVQEWGVTTDYKNYSFTYDGMVESLLVHLSNHDYVAGEIDYNLNVDYIIVNGDTTQTNAPETYGEGVKLTDISGFCNQGTDFTREKLFCEGFFEYSITPDDCDDEGTTYYFITNRATGDRFYPESDADNAPLLKANEGRSDDLVQWGKIPTDGGYFYLKNKATGKYFRPKDDNDGVTVWQVPTNFTGAYTQWTEVSVSGGFYHLQNRATGKYFRPLSDTPDSPIQQQPNTWTGHWTQWTIEPVNAPKLQTDNLTFNLYPNPADDYIRIETQHISENSTVSIYDVSGKLVMHQAVNTDIFDISVQNLKAGMYIVRLDIGDGTYAAQRFVVQ